MLSTACDDSRVTGNGNHSVQAEGYFLHLFVGVCDTTTIAGPSVTWQLQVVHAAPPFGDGDGDPTDAGAGDAEAPPLPLPFVFEPPPPVVEPVVEPPPPVVDPVELPPLPGGDDAAGAALGLAAPGTTWLGDGGWVRASAVGSALGVAEMDGFTNVTAFATLIAKSKTQ